MADRLRASSSSEGFIIISHDDVAPVKSGSSLNNAITAHISRPKMLPLHIKTKLDETTTSIQKFKAVMDTKSLAKSAKSTIKASSKPLAAI
ncbi:hypothetical protein CkaCkLH20_12824 [Colletotrichum karsti]|uniref:Uncharacterized protein n=1 Tax=Colletotrichum karsti TaxID=1095194 RepID=A0A9P6HS49_9PEZI|nr:uncharacterized protein CkaCkLH20_12824 [Colletotrichum karsti]KAF9869637.1 hypothetical protein CkaCkLH20_12824 [Colletotrichum karsti]